MLTETFVSFQPAPLAAGEGVAVVVGAIESAGDTVTVNCAEPEPVPSFTETVTVFMPVVAYVWDRGPSVQGAAQTAFAVLPATVKVSFPEPSPQFTVTDQDASAPGSVNDPSARLAD
jgi:hypothetical protein